MKLLIKIYLYLIYMSLSYLHILPICLPIIYFICFLYKHTLHSLSLSLSYLTPLFTIHLLLSLFYLFISSFSSPLSPLFLISSKLFTTLFLCSLHIINLINSHWLLSPYSPLYIPTSIIIIYYMKWTT